MPPLPPLSPLLLLLLVLARERSLCRGDVTARMRHLDQLPPPGIGRQMMTRPLLMHPYNVQPGETPSTGPTGKLLHPALVAPMPVQGILDRITPVAAWATIPKNRLWNTVGVLASITREYNRKSTSPFAGFFLDIECEKLIVSKLFAISPVQILSVSSSFRGWPSRKLRIVSKRMNRWNRSVFLSNYWWDTQAWERISISR